MMKVHSNSSLGYWDQYFHSLGAVNTEAMSLVAVMDHHHGSNNSVPFFASNLLSHDDHLHADYNDDHLSSGYLEDALVEYSDNSKRRRLLTIPDEDIAIGDFNFLSKGCFSSSNWELSQSFGDFHELSGWPVETPMCSIGEEANMTKSMSEILDSSASSASSYKDSANNTAKLTTVSDMETLLPVDPSGEEKRTSASKKRAGPGVARRVLCPFAVVKPGGREGDITLSDINERIMMPPTRPVRHPVGDFACRPCVSGHGPGLSGKAVVALTRIHTRGRGTVTIIRTRG